MMMAFFIVLMLTSALMKLIIVIIILSVTIPLVALLVPVSKVSNKLTTLLARMLMNAREVTMIVVSTQFARI